MHLQRYYALYWNWIQVEFIIQYLSIINSNLIRYPNWQDDPLPPIDIKIETNTNSISYQNQALFIVTKKHHSLMQKQIKLRVVCLTYGILEALSFHTANSPSEAKKPKPPHSQAKASYCSSPTQQKKKGRFQKKNQIRRRIRSLWLCIITFPTVSAMRSIQGSGNGVPLSQTSSSFTGSWSTENK